MGILDRFTDIIKANINDLLDRAEDPAKMIDQYMRELTDNLAEVKEETAAVMAEESRTKRLVDQNAAEVAKYQGLARRALEAGNEGDARVFLAKKQELESKGQALSTTYEAAKANAQKMRDLHDKLVTDIETLNGRREAIKAKVSVAKTQSKVNEFSSGADKAEGAMAAFARMEAKADQMLDQANAEAELSKSAGDRAAELEAQYAAAGNTKAVDDELARLKAEMGLSAGHRPRLGAEGKQANAAIGAVGVQCRRPRRVRVDAGRRRCAVFQGRVNGLGSDGSTLANPLWNICG